MRPTATPEIRIAWYGTFSGEGSLARVNRHLVRAILAGGRVDVIPCGEPAPQIEALLGLPPRRREDLPADGAATVSLRHRWPPRFLNPPGGHAIHMQPWEFGMPPQAWVDRLRERGDDVWCYTSYVRDVYLDGGLPAERVHVVPLGFDPQIYHPGVAPLPIDPPGLCVFVFVGGTLPRKNLATLITAYTAAFSARDPVALVIKDNPAVGAYDARSGDTLRALAARTDIAPIRYLDAEFRDADMARLYRAAAALVHPYRGEGFALPVLEAMACGTPAIVSAGGACDDFVDELVGYRVRATRQPLGTVLGDLPLAGEGWWLDPDATDLAGTLRRVFEQRAEARARGAAAAERAHGGWTWAHAAERAVARLRAVVAAPPMPPRAAHEALADYERAESSPTGMPGILEELFARLRLVDPIFVDVGAGDGPARPSSVFATRFGWRGLVLAGDASAGAIADALSGSAMPAGSSIDLACLDASAASVWPALAPLRPRVVVLAAGDALGGALAPDYACLGTESSGAEAVYVRRRLLPLVAFPERAP